MTARSLPKPNSAASFRSRRPGKSTGGSPAPHGSIPILSIRSLICSHAAVDRRISARARRRTSCHPFFGGPGKIFAVQGASTNTRLPLRWDSMSAKRRYRWAEGFPGAGKASAGPRCCVIAQRARSGNTAFPRHRSSGRTGGRYDGLDTPGIMVSRKAAVPSGMQMIQSASGASRAAPNPAPLGSRRHGNDIKREPR